MISGFKLIRNVGPFDNVTTGSTLLFAKLSVVYAENGRGKTTLAAILRALSSGTSAPVRERKRLGATHEPHVIVDTDDREPVAVFKDGVWSRSVPEIVVFDDTFIDENVYSGLSVDPQHRQRLHELVIGSEAVVLGKELQDLVKKIEEHNRQLRARENAIPVATRGSLSVDEFCALTLDARLAEKTALATQALDAASDKAKVIGGAAFAEMSPPGFDVSAIDAILKRDLPELDARTLTVVRTRLEAVGDGGEVWVSEGMGLLSHESDPSRPEFCPFCAQDLRNSPAIDSYRAYFSEGYESLKTKIAEVINEVAREHGEAAIALFERTVRQNAECATFWAKYLTTAAASTETDALSSAWRAARSAVEKVLIAKESAPLEALALDEASLRLIGVYEAQRALIEALNPHVRTNNDAIKALREGIEAADTKSLEWKLAGLSLLKRRFEPSSVAACDAYLRERGAKESTEALRAGKRARLDAHRAKTFPKYEAATNRYLQHFNAGFRIGELKGSNPRGGASCTYSVVINSTPLPVGSAVEAGEPSFRTALSAGDRNALALAFFFASLDLEASASEKIVVLDDAVSSLDEHRLSTTVEQVRALCDRVAQVIVLSHSKPFLCSIWESLSAEERSAIEVSRIAQGSTLGPWGVTSEVITAHDRRAQRLSDYADSGTGELRDVARDMRPHLEGFLRVACSVAFPPGTRLGNFIAGCDRHVGKGGEILSQSDLTELRLLVGYANKFQHDTNPAWRSEMINDGELHGYVNRTLAFCRKGRDGSIVG